MTKLKNNIVIVGQGAIGLLWYHHLSQASNDTNLTAIIGANVSLLASNQNKLSTLELKSAQYKFTSFEEEHADTYQLTYAQTAEIKRANIIMLCVKSYNIATALEAIAKDINPLCQVILAHNGMGTFEEVVKLMPSEQPILAMLTTHGCLRRLELNIEHTGLGHSDIGLLSGDLNATKQSELSNLLSCALPTVTFHSDISQKQWLKLAINCVINPITAINDIDNGKVNDEKYSPLVNQLLAEITLISQKEGINLKLTDLQETVKKVAQATAKNCSSMRCDVLANRPTEVDYINGFIHRLGRKHNIATPENTRLWQQVLNLRT